MDGTRHTERMDAMTHSPREAATGGAAAQGLLELFGRAGYRRVETAILQPADLVLDLAGEEMRRRIFLTTDGAGREWCLRPDITIPLCRDHLANGSADAPAGYSYLGPVFRDRPEGSGEFLQAGIESIGRTDREAADAEALALGFEAAAHYGISAPRCRIGDVSLFAALVAALDLPPQWRRRLMKDFTRVGGLSDDLDLLATARPNSAYSGVLAALAGQDRASARAVVADLLSIAGITTVGGRSAGEIAERFLEQAALGATAALPDDTVAIVERFLAIDGDPDEGADALRTLASDTGLALTEAIDRFEHRIGFFAARGLDVPSMHFSTAFGRGLEYYSGFVFELHDPKDRVVGQLVAGGRYDGLLRLLGAAKDIPAVGFSCWIERLDSAGARA